jgi:hypothetical protein
MDVPAWLKLVVADPAEYRRRLLIDTANGLNFLDDVADPWQREDFLALDPGWKRCVGLSTEGIQRAYLERARGHAKTSDIATMATWALIAAKRPICGVVAAGDLDQARLLRDGIDRLVKANPWLTLLLTVNNYRIVNRITSSTCDVLASDAASNYGLTPDFLVCDELTHWTKEEMWNAMFSAAAKKANCMVLIIANAGVGEGTSWQWRIREAARESESWYFRRLDGPMASWISEAMLDEQKNMLPGAAYKRLWLNQWVRGTGDALEPSDIEACCTLTQVPERGWDGWTHVQGLDLGIKHDHAALVVLACKPGEGHVRLAYCRSWKPAKGGEVDLIAVQRAVAECTLNYGSTVTFYDPHQCALMAQQLRRIGIRMEEQPFVGQALNRMASTILQVFSSRRIELYRDEDLIRDLLRLTIMEKSYGYKLEAVSDEFGHADRAIALSIALPTAAEISELGIRFDDGLGNNIFGRG